MHLFICILKVDVLLAANVLEPQVFQISFSARPNQSCLPLNAKAADSDEEREEVLKEEHLSLQPVVDILDALTGSPVADDVLLFAIPVCAPYNAMQSYK